MNRIDVKNIEMCIKAREAQIFHLEQGGDMTYEDIDKHSTEELKELIKQFYESKKEQFFDLFKRKVDNFFKKYTDFEEVQNVIVIGACNSENRYINKIDPSDIFAVINFDKHQFNKKLYAVGSEENAYETENNDFVDGTRDLYDDLVLNEYILPIDKYFAHTDSINDVWYGCYGITPQYEIISFIMRKDGVLLNNDIRTIYSIRN